MTFHDVCSCHGSRGGELSGVDRRLERHLPAVPPFRLYFRIEHVFIRFISLMLGGME
jgi:hypothetical protein